MGELSQKHYVNGEWKPSQGEEFASENPATGEIIWVGNSADTNAVNEAVTAAKEAFNSWRVLSVDERNAFVDKFIDQVKSREKDLAQEIHIETGKPLWESKTEINSMIGKAAISVNAYSDRTGSSEKEANNVSIKLAHRPIGVFAVLGPYNFPGHLPNGHIIPALLAGNTIVFKPSELTPKFGELMVQCWADAEIPNGVINLLQGARAAGEALVSSESIDGVLFTGSSATGHAIHKSLGGQPNKMLALEMGGNNPLVVDEVSDLDAAVYTIVQSAFISAGQRCTCARRLILVRNAANKELLSKLGRATMQIKVGSDDDCFIGPVISNMAADNVVEFERELIEKGGVSILPLRRPDNDRPFLQPALIDTTAAKGLDDKECFGPLLQVKWVEDLSSAIEEANNTHYGLSAGLLSNNPESWNLFYRDIRAGIVNFNRAITGASGAAPFGGVGASGNYRPGAYYAADYSAYPIASMASNSVELPENLAPGITL